MVLYLDQYSTTHWLCPATIYNMAILPYTIAALRVDATTT